ncbi:polymorphic toxin-type HINT domain-containing protein [Prevotella histicola]|uniref:polymorphic toxin-type HINT domain-containing protein n=1 Tax=Prevotella histicola TaxID=470565 RepID=UPI0028F08C7E|nr:polymorphic toxin-type HINT domain-containing protein [Prevotella histicola]
MANEQYLTEAHYLTCSKGAKPVRVSVDSQKSIKFSGSLAATSKDLQTKSNFICLGAVAFGAGAAVGVVATLSACALIPGPGWVVAAIIAAIIIAALLLAGGKCACAAATRFWLPGTTSQRSKLNGAPLLILSSQMSCPAEGGCITAQATLWEAWGRQTLTNLGHIANFAFGFLVGRGASAMVVEAGAAASVSAAGQTGSQVAGTFIRSLGKNFLNTAKENLVQQFTGWNQGGMFCRFMKGFGLYGQAKEHYDIWTDDEKSTWEKIKASGMSLILDVFAAKGATTVCFPAGTKVHTLWGLADIEKLEVGVPVLTYNEETGEQEYKKVKKVMRRMTRRMCAMELSNGTTLEVTPEHRFFCDGEWIPIEELNVNDTLQLKDNSIVVIENKIIFPTFVEVYNLEIEDNENYYVTEEGVLVHNGYREEYLGRTPSKKSKTGREVFDRMLKTDPPTARLKNEFGEDVKEFWDPDNKVWRDISEADMGHIHDAVTYWNETGRYFGAKSKKVREWMLSSKNYILEYYKTNRSKGAILGKTTTYLPPFK